MLRCVLADFVTHPGDELLDDWTFGGARMDEDEICSPLQYRFTAERRD
jgi:hypothetical protein